MQSVTAPVPFLETPGDPPVKWKQWFDGFETYLGAIGAIKFSAERRKYLLLHSLGYEGRSILKHLPPAPVVPGEEPCDEYDETVSKLQARFDVQPSIVVLRHKFFLCTQKNGEDVDTYITALRKLAADCQFENFSDQLVRDQFICHCSDKMIKQKLLSMGDPSLEETIRMAKSIETSLISARELESKSSDVVAAVKVKSKVHEFKHETKPRCTSTSSPGVPFSRTDVCYRCGNRPHPNRSRCPALYVTCNKCGKVGHFARICQSPRGRSNTPGPVSIKCVAEGNASCSGEDDSSESVTRELSEMVMVVQDMGVIKGNPELCKDPYVDIIVGDKSVKLLVDSGARISMITSELYDYTWPGRLLCPPDRKAISYEGREIDLAGYIEDIMEFKGRKIWGKLYVATRGLNILGWFHQGLFGMILQPGAAEQVLAVRDDPGLEGLVSEFPRVFSGELGKIKGFQHKIVVKSNARPIKHKLRNVPFSVRQDLEKELNALCARGIIEPIESSLWLSPLVVARKQNGEIRVCVDLRCLNREIWVDSHPLPTISELLTSMKDAKVFSKLDLASAYHQVELAPESRPLTAFVSPFGTFQYVRMPFGLSSAASVFQRLMAGMLKGIEGVSVFQDDVLIYAPNDLLHDTRLREVLTRLQASGVVLRRDKCKFKTNEVEYLGHMVNEKGILPKSGLVESIVKALPPSDKSGLKSFLGLCEFYSRFIPDFASRLRPLSRMLTKGVNFKWGVDCQGAFDWVKHQLTSPRILKSFDPSLTCTLSVDASSVGLGAVLFQKDDKGVRTIGYASRVLSPTETKYSVIEKELLACWWAVIKFRNYIWGRRFHLQTDHKPLVFILNGENVRSQTPRIARLASKLLQFDFSVEHIPGRANGCADFLSRSSDLIEVVDDVQEQDREDFIVAAVELPSLCAISEKEWREALQLDSSMLQVLTYVKDGWPKERNLSFEFKTLLQVAEELSIEDGLLLRGDKLVPPASLRLDLIKRAHEGHLGITMTKRRLRLSFWWPYMDAEVEEFVKSCVVCSSCDKSAKLHTPPLCPIELPSAPWVKLGMDIVGPFHGLDSSSKFALVLMDYYSKWPEIKFVHEVTSRSVIEFLREIFMKEGFPETIVTDNGTQFTALEVEEFLQNSGVKHCKSSLYHPQTNGLVERMNKVLGECIQWALAGKHVVVNAVRSMLWFYRTTPHSSTGVTPFQLLRGRRAATLFCPSWMSRWVKGEVWSDAVIRKKVEVVQSKQKSHFDSSKRVKDVCILVGEFVRVKKPVHVRKGSSKFGPPAKVVEVKGNSVKLDSGQWWNKCLVSKCCGSSVVEHVGETFQQDCAGPTSLRRSARARTVPLRFRT